MESGNIEKLLEKYFEAETTLAEEKQLKEYFSGNQIAEHLAQYRAFFGYFKEEPNHISVKEIELPKERKFNMKFISIAASFLLMVSVFSYQQYQHNQEVAAREAFAKTQEALQLISQNLNKGNKAIAQLNYYEETQRKIFKNE
ncbi:hypothetical protein [Namhaeicola litoreus]|uniref:Anti-sigma factor n=1 Tax=Namhaeicola litoreus TaxID=1052145 RepID=A0ABW3Y2Q1_9FLAO